jgi:hypothetical protein
VNRAVAFKLAAMLMNHIERSKYELALEVCREIEDLIIIDINKEKDHENEACKKNG